MAESNHSFLDAAEQAMNLSNEPDLNTMEYHGKAYHNSNFPQDALFDNPYNRDIGYLSESQQNDEEEKNMKTPDKKGPGNIEVPAILQTPLQYERLQDLPSAQSDLRVIEQIQEAKQEHYVEHNLRSRTTPQKNTNVEETKSPQIKYGKRQTKNSVKQEGIADPITNYNLRSSDAPQDITNSCRLTESEQEIGKKLLGYNFEILKVKLKCLQEADQEGCKKHLMKIKGINSKVASSINYAEETALLGIPTVAKKLNINENEFKKILSTYKIKNEGKPYAITNSWTQDDESVFREYL